MSNELLNSKIDSIQKWVETLQPCEMPLTHLFLPGLYVRTIKMPKGAWVVSHTHKLEHPFVVTKGVVSVYDTITGVQQIKAGHIGVTKPGTQRILFIHDDCEWTTFHVGNWAADTDPNSIVAEVTEPVRDVSNAPQLTPDVIKMLEEAPV